MALVQLLNLAAHPIGREPEGLLRRVQDAGPLDVQVVVGDGDVLRAGPVGRSRDGPRQLLLADLGTELDGLSGLDVGREPDDELRVALQGGRVHAAATLP